MDMYVCEYCGETIQHMNDHAPDCKVGMAQIDGKFERLRARVSELEQERDEARAVAVWHAKHILSCCDK